MQSLRVAFAGRSATEAFQFFDKDDDGTMTRQEFRAGFQKLGISITVGDMRLWCTCVDRVAPPPPPPRDSLSQGIM